jgi:hypothetical protein
MRVGNFASKKCASCGYDLVINGSTLQLVNPLDGTVISTIDRDGGWTVGAMARNGDYAWDARLLSLLIRGLEFISHAIACETGRPQSLASLLHESAGSQKTLL